MDILKVVVGIVIGVLIGRYLFPFMGKEIASLHAKIDALIAELKQKL